MANSKILTVRIDREKFDSIVDIASERHCRPSDIIKSAINAYLGAASVMATSQLRLARINEFTQIAVDILIREQFPEYRDRIVAEVDKRLGQYHGA